MLKLTTHDAITEIQLARPPANALNLELLQAMQQAIADTVANGSKGIVLSGATGMFCAGVDVPALLGTDRNTVHAFWRALYRTCSALATSPVPIVAAITGHSPAGGAVLALFCDYRVMAEGPYKIGLNEVQVGLTVPEPIQMAMRRVLGSYRAERLLVSGRMLEAGDALACGLVDELTGVDQVTTRALHWLRQLLVLPPHAMLSTRAIARADLHRIWSDPDSIPVEPFIDAFYNDETQIVLHALVARLKSRK